MTATIIALVLIRLSVSMIVIVSAFKLIRFLHAEWMQRSTGKQCRGRSTAEMILRERFASGEIDEEEMKRRSAVL